MKSVFVTLDKERELRYDISAALRLDREHGINIMDPASFKSFSPKVAAALLWAGQLHCEDALPLAKVEKYLPLDQEAYVALMIKISEALASALGHDTP